MATTTKTIVEVSSITSANLKEVLMGSLTTKDLETAKAIKSRIQALKEEASLMARTFDEFRKICDDTGLWVEFVSEVEKINKMGRQAGEVSAEAKLAKFLNG